MFAIWQLKASSISDAELIYLPSILISIFQELSSLISFGKFLGVPFSDFRHLKQVDVDEKIGKLENLYSPLNMN